MATGGGPTPSSSDDRRESMTCSLCLDIFTQPKLLPCSHTFCLKCLEDLTASRPSSTFPCPQCRAEVTIPPGGVSAFQNNFYIRPEDLDVAREGIQCLTHPKQDLDLFCIDCRVTVCLKCVLTKHKQHNTQDLSDAAREAKTQLSQDEDRLQKAVSFMIQEVEAEKKEQQSLLNKKAALETSIRNKHATVVALADKYRDELLASVNTACERIETNVRKTLAEKTGSLEELCHLQQRLQDTLSNGTGCAQVSMAKEMREGKGSPRTVETMMSNKRSTLSRPVVNSPLTFNTLMRDVEKFFGAVSTVEVNVTPAEVTVEEKFTCRKEKDTEVYSLCPKGDGLVWVAYAHCGLRGDVFSELFQENGGHRRTSTKGFGKSSWKCRGNGRILFLKPSENAIKTHAKSICLTNNHVTIHNGLHGKADVKREKVTSDDPFKSESVREFSINVGAHRAFDVDASDQLFAVVEEPPVADQPRKVKLYQRNKPDAIDTYRPPSQPFNPADVCFFSLGGKEALVIADEAGDSLHVVHVQGGALTFVRHLAPGCSLLVQPTALNTDHVGRLWVACEGSRILTLTPVS